MHFISKNYTFDEKFLRVSQGWAFELPAFASYFNISKPIKSIEVELR